MGGGEEGRGGCGGRGAPPGRKLNINQSIAVSQATQQQRGCRGGRGTEEGRVESWEEGEEGRERVGGGRAVWRGPRARARDGGGPMAGNRVPREAVAAAGGWVRPGEGGRCGPGSLPPPPRGGSRARPPRPAQRRTSPGAEAAAATRLALVAWSPGEGTDPRAGGNRGCLSSGFY